MKFVASLFIVFLALSPAAAKEKWTVDDVVLADEANGFMLSPDSRWVVWVKSVVNKEKGKRIANLMRTDLKENETIELTRGEDDCENPMWSPDGKLLAFTSGRQAPKTETDKRSKRSGTTKDEKDGPKKQIWLINPFGGEAWRLTDYPRDIKHFAWADSDRLFFTAKEEKSHRAKIVDDDDKDTTEVVEDERHEPPVRLFQIVLKTKKIERLTANVDRIDMLAVSPNGKWAVTRHSRSLSYEYDAKAKPIVVLHDLTSMTAKPIFADKKFNIGGVKWLPDSKSLLAIHNHNSNPQYAEPAVAQIYHFDPATGGEALIDLDWERGLANQEANSSEPGLIPVNDGFLALMNDGARTRLARFHRHGDQWKRVWLEGEHVSNTFGLSTRDGVALVYSHSSASTPAEWYQAKISGNRIGNATAFTTLNEKFNDLPIAKSELIHWKGARGEEVEGILYYPHEFKKGKRYPLVVMIHGGPSYADPDMWEETWAYAPNLFCQRNAFVFKPNYHGSSNYGLKWLESITNGKYYDLEIPDIEKGVDFLIDKGIVDKDKLGLIGWSNGAILGIELTARTTRYKVAALGAGDVDWTSDWANCEFGDAFDRFYLGKGPIEDPQLYFKKSPFYRLDKVRTPTLIFFGSEDRTVATQQGWMHYRGLQQLGKAEVRFVLFPGEKHSPEKYIHQKRKLQEELAWFDKYLFNNAPEENEALKKDSALASRLKVSTAARSGDVFGVACKDQVIPEIVTYEGIGVSRFEVTRAQYRCFDAKYSVGKGTEDYPAGNISFDEAKKYCEWLGKLTGDRYQLPNADEADKLYGHPEEGENTLDHWAGYAVNPDDAKRLAHEIETLTPASLLFRQTGAKAPLLRPVGQFRATGEEGIFDLGGNVAEWVTAKDGKGKSMGGSADRPADEKAVSSLAGSQYQGFRVIKENRERK